MSLLFLPLVTLPASFRFSDSFLAFGFARLFWDTAGFFATFFLDSRDGESRSPKTLCVGSFVALFAFCRVLLGASFSVEEVAFFVLGCFFLDASSFLVGTSKNRDREGGRKEAAGDGAEGVEVFEDISNVLSVLLEALVG